jgi:hypothetical protein
LCLRIFDSTSALRYHRDSCQYSHTNSVCSAILLESTTRLSLMILVVNQYNFLIKIVVTGFSPSHVEAKLTGFNC